MARALSDAGLAVGLMDADIHGPSIPKLLNVEGRNVGHDGKGIVPIEVGGLKVMSIGFLLRSQDDAVIWRGPMKYSLIKQFFEEVGWGRLDALIVDCPPGTGDEPLSVVQLLGKVTGAIVVTTPQDLAIVDVRKCVTFCRSLNVPVAGVIENMSGFACPSCGAVASVFKVGGGKRMAGEMGIPFLGAIPLDPLVTQSGDAGTPFVSLRDSGPTAEAITAAVAPILATVRGHHARGTESDERTDQDEKTQADKQAGGSYMRIAIPVVDGSLSMHFGHCERFVFFDVDPDEKKIVSRQSEDSPPHQPGMLPPWMHERGVNVVIAGGMGIRAQRLFDEHGVKVLVGAPAEDPESIVERYLAGTLETGANVCDH
jgi:predicted Fe-Mo cluster-binding NifX family protein/MinD-like ATPase involved in chromosome partitioning or flagellar assembly